jgi:hypothetical protein
VLPVIPKDTDLVTVAMAETYTTGPNVETVDPARYVKSALLPNVVSTIRC